MKKSDLKSGMTVKIRKGERYLVIKNYETKLYGVCDVLVNKNSFLTLNDYNEDLILKDKNDFQFDIMEVYKPVYDSHIFDFEEHELIWEREEAKEMTLEEIEKELGYKIEIVKEDKQND